MGSGSGLQALSAASDDALEVRSRTLAVWLGDPASVVFVGRGCGDVMCYPIGRPWTVELARWVQCLIECDEPV